MTTRTRSAHTYSPYGHSSAESLGFNGERRDVITGFYLLGTGYHRLFSPSLMRFVSADSWSPFGLGGLNCYCYSQCDPINFVDPSGHMGRKHGSVTFAVAKKSSKEQSSAGPNPLRQPGPSTIDHATPARTFSPDALELVQHYRLEQQPLPKNSGYTLNSDKAKYKGVLNEDQQRRLKLFKLIIQDLGASPNDAADFVTLRIKPLHGATVNQHQLQLGGYDRVTFTIEDKVVTIRQIGGHS
ncbi:RHS repeat-associated core domain-containing protein [Pseudomonas sp. S13.1.2]|uniref:RHS repeat-associated core domain-containing protein n=1 Tax=Pseudomonas TaxID=286 RepID=UPI0009BACB87